MDPTTPRFRFRDQGLDDDSAESDSSKDDSSSSESGDDDSKLKSMTGKGIRRLCSELLELKKASDDDFHRNVYSNYSAFVRIFKEVEGLENELMELKQHISTQKKLLYDLTHGIYLEVLFEESIESIAESTLDTEQHPPSELETHANAITETLDILISEFRLYEALIIFETEPANLQRILSQEDFPSEIVMSYKSAMSERRKRLTDQFVQVAEHPRVATPEFQLALSGLCRLGYSHRANLLLLQFYNSRFEDGILDLQHSKSFMNEIYIRELAKQVFSVISQAGNSFITLHGETSPYSSEFMQWAMGKTEEFVYYFDNYVKSISETTGALDMAVEAVQHALSFCSLLESRKILLQPHLKNMIRPCMERVLQMHIGHFKNVIAIFTSTDPWVPGRYLVSEFLGDMPSYVEIGGKLEYCLLTNSGRKFATVVQATVEDTLPLASLQMENSILQGIFDLFNAYVDNLIRSIPNEANEVEESSPVTNMANTLYQQLCLLANVSTLVLHLFSIITEIISKGTKFSEDEALAEQTEMLQQKELDSWILSIQEAADRLRAYFCQQFVSKAMSFQDEQILCPETKEDGRSECHSLHAPLPSITCQVLFLQLRQLEKLAREVFVGWDWEVEDLLRELMEAVFVWLSNNKEFWTVTGESSVAEGSGGFEQFLLDMQFLVEIARFGEYLSENLMGASLSLIESKEMEFLAAGLSPKSDILCDGWAANTAKAAIGKLLEIEKTKFPPMEGPVGTLEEYFGEQQHEDAEDFVEVDGGRYLLEYEKSASGAESPCVSAEADFDDTAENLSNNSIYLEVPGATSSANVTTPILQDIEETERPLGTFEEYFHKQQQEDATSSANVYLEDLHVANSANSTTAISQEMEETDVLSPESSTGILKEVFNKNTAEVCDDEDATSSSGNSDNTLDEKGANEANSVIEANAELESLAAVGTEPVLDEDSSKLGCERPTTNEAETVIGEQQYLGGVDSPAMEGYDFNVVEGSDEEEKQYYCNSFEGEVPNALKNLMDSEGSTSTSINSSHSQWVLSLK